MHVKHGPQICPVAPVCQSSRSELLLWKNHNGTGGSEEKGELLSIYTAVVLPSQSKKERKPPGSRRQRLQHKLRHERGEDDETPQR